MLVPLEKSLRRAPGGGIVSPVTQTRFLGGQFIPAELWAQQKQQAKDALPALLERTGDRLQTLRAFYDQNSQLRIEGVTKVSLVSLTRIEQQMKDAVAQAYDEAFLLGKRASGNLFAETDEDRKAVRAVRVDEYRYLRKFAEDMKSQGGRMKYDVRMDYYKFAVRELWNLGFIIGNKTPGRFLLWRMSDKIKEHCTSCLYMSRLGWLPVEKFIKVVARTGFIPQSGKLECRGRFCGCQVLEEFRKVTNGQISP